MNDIDLKFETFQCSMKELDKCNLEIKPNMWKKKKMKYVQQCQLEMLLVYYQWHLLCLDEINAFY